MNEALQKAWKQAEANPGTPVDIGAIVVCDSCSDDCTTSTVSGGFIFGSSGYCPKCAPSFLKTIQQYNEEHFIKARCPEGQSFADFIRAYRGGNNTVVVRSIETPKCRNCKQAFSDANVHTTAGWAETRFSGMCENCWDAMFGYEGDDE